MREEAPEVRDGMSNVIAMLAPYIHEGRLVGWSQLYGRIYFSTTRRSKTKNNKRGGISIFHLEKNLSLRVT